MSLKKLFLFVLYLLGCFLFLFDLVYSQEYYADILIDVEGNGLISIDGRTNYDFFKNISNSPHFTSKKGEIWTLNINSKDIIDDFIFELNLPENSVITYIKTTPSFRIEEENNRIKLIGTGENKSFLLLVQYKIDYKYSFISQNNLVNLLILILILLIIFIIYKYFINKNLRNSKDDKHDVILNSKNMNNSNKSNGNIDENNVNKIKNLENKVNDNFLNGLDISILSQRQQDIINILKENEKISQKNLEKIMNIPKSSLSRNINSLLNKKILKKEISGVTNYISLNND